MSRILVVGSPRDFELLHYFFNAQFAEFEIVLGKYGLLFCLFTEPFGRAKYFTLFFADDSPALVHSLIKSFSNGANDPIRFNNRSPWGELVLVSIKGSVMLLNPIPAFLKLSTNFTRWIRLLTIRSNFQTKRVSRIISHELLCHFTFHFWILTNPSMFLNDMSILKYGKKPRFERIFKLTQSKWRN